MKRIIWFLVLVLGMAVGVQAQDGAASFRTGQIPEPWYPILGPGSQPLADSSYIQILLAGANGVPDLPGPNGEPTGDDVQPTGNNMDHLILGVGEPPFIPVGNLFLGNGGFIMPSPGGGVEPVVNLGDAMFLRAFNSPDPATATYYNDIVTVNGVAATTYTQSTPTPEVVILCFDRARRLGPTPIIDVSPNQLDFENVIVGQLAQLPLTIHNYGDSTLVLYDFYTSHFCFGTSWNPADSLIIPGGSLEITTYFAPVSVMQYQEFLTIDNNDHMVQVGLEGEGYVPSPEIGVSSQMLNFGFVDVGDTGRLPLTIYNLSEDTLVVFDIVNYDPVYSTNFDPVDSIVTPHDSLLIMVEFQPMQQMWYMDTLDIENNDELVQVALMGFGVWSGFGLPERSGLPEVYAIWNAYPNPFNALATIRYDVPVMGEVEIRVFDVLGRKVGLLEDGVKDVGYHQVVWDAGDLSSGVYFVQMEAGEFTQTRKVVLLK